MTRAVASKLAAATALAGLLLVPEPATAQIGYEILHRFPPMPVGPKSGLAQGTDGVLYGSTIGMGGTVFALRPKSEGGPSLTILHAFDIPPAARLIQGRDPQTRDGELYGTTGGGGTGFGTVFKISPAGALTTLHVFTGADGAEPLAALVQARGGNFYGTTKGGGAFNRGTVFRMTAAGTLTTLHSFTGGTDGTGPIAPLIQAADGRFYGTTSWDANTRATIFRITPGGTLTTLYTFGEFEGPGGGLVQGNDGDFYGTINVFPLLIESKAFKITSNGTFTHLHTFTESEGVDSMDSLIQASDGNFYGTMFSGGAGPNPIVGTIYKMTPAGDVTVLHAFTRVEGGNPESGLIQARDGLLYGVTDDGGPIGHGTVYSIDTAGVFTMVHGLQTPEGCQPWSGLVQAHDGAFYGTTNFGGLYASGTIYRMTADGTFTTLHTFGGPEGATPFASLLLASDGNFYGTTRYGGKSNKGAIFRMTPEGIVTTLHSFSGSDGAEPWAPLIQANDGNLHGTTSFGGGANLGTLFQISLSGDFVSYHSFAAWPLSAGEIPYAPLVQVRDGSFYGSGFSAWPFTGAIFKVIPGGVLPLIWPGGGHVAAGLTEGSDGNLYTTSFGETNYTLPPPVNAGVVVKLAPEGVSTLLHRFNQNLTEGSRPTNAPIEASDGNFYGTTIRYAGGSGSIYQVTPTGTFTTLKILTEAEGTQPSAKLLQASDGALYGAAYSGGTGGCGLIFRFTIPEASSGPIVRAGGHGHR